MSGNLKCVLVLALLGASCVEPLDTPTAYESEPYLCGSEAATEWAHEIAACRREYDEDRECGGVFSFRGRLQGTPLTVTSRLTSALFENLRGGGQVLRDEYNATGDSPYFTFTLQLKDVGGEVSDEPRSLMVSVKRGDPVQPLEDDAVAMSMRLSTGGDSKDLRALSGSVRLTLQSERESGGTFEGSFGTADDQIEGCFHMFATRVTEKEAVAP